MLTRIYGTAWKDDKDLKKYLNQIEEAEKRDHRKIGKELELFHFQDEAPGMVFWHERGWTIYKTLQNYMRNKLELNDYSAPELKKIFSDMEAEGFKLDPKESAKAEAAEIKAEKQAADAKAKKQKGRMLGR